MFDQGRKIYIIKLFYKQNRKKKFSRWLLNTANYKVKKTCTLCQTILILGKIIPYIDKILEHYKVWQLNDMI